MRSTHLAANNTPTDKKATSNWKWPFEIEQADKSELRNGAFGTLLRLVFLIEGRH